VKGQKRSGGEIPAFGKRPKTKPSGMGGEEPNRKKRQETKKKGPGGSIKKIFCARSLSSVRKRTEGTYQGGRNKIQKKRNPTSSMMESTYEQKKPKDQGRTSREKSLTKGKRPTRGCSGATALQGSAQSQEKNKLRISRKRRELLRRGRKERRMGDPSKCRKKDCITLGLGLEKKERSKNKKKAQPSTKEGRAFKRMKNLKGWGRSRKKTTKKPEK